MGWVGFVLGKQSMQSSEPDTAAVADDTHVNDVLYEMPLGNMAIQVLQPKSIVHVVINASVFFSSSTEFEQMNGTLGRAKLRDATITAFSDFAETSLWIKDGREADITKEGLSKQIAGRLSRTYPSIRGARMNQFVVARTLRTN
jgi:hypothetical protein